MNTLPVPNFEFNPHLRERTVSVYVYISVSVRRPGDGYDKSTSDSHTLHVAECDVYAVTQLLQPMLLSCLTELKDNEAQAKETPDE